MYSREMASKRAPQLLLKNVVQNGQRFYAVEQQGSKNPRVVPSVTTILGTAVNKPQLASWQKKISVEYFKKKLLSVSPMKKTGRTLPPDAVLDEIAAEAMNAPDQEKDKAATFGTRSHSLFELIIRENMSTFECNCELKKVRDAFLDWREHVAKRARLIVEQSEVPIFSAKYGYAGTMDALATMPKAGSGRGASQERSLVVLDWKTSNYMRVEYAWQVAAYIKAYEEMTEQKIDDAFLVRLEKDSGDFEVRRIRDIDVAFQGFLACLSVYNAVNETNSYFT